MKKEYKYLLAILFMIIAAFLYAYEPPKQVQYTIENSSVSTQLILTNNLSIVCVSGYSATVRDVSDKLKNEIYQRDGIIRSDKTAIDHIIPLCLGGSNHPDNLRAMFVSEKVKKDNLERYLCNSHVCDGDIDINYAQRRIYENWSSFYEEIYG